MLRRTVDCRVLALLSSRCSHFLYTKLTSARRKVLFMCGGGFSVQNTQWQIIRFYAPASRSCQKVNHPNALSIVVKTLNEIATCYSASFTPVNAPAALFRLTENWSLSGRWWQKLTSAQSVPTPNVVHTNIVGMFKKVLQRIYLGAQ